MFPFLKRRKLDRGWLAWPTASVLGNRRALLLSPRQFEREVARERIRSTRRSLPFCVLNVELLAVTAMHLANDDAASPSTRRGRRTTQLKKQSRRLVDILHHHLRVTDEKGVLSAARYGVLLVDTPEMGGRAVLDRLTELTSAAGVQVQMNLEVHDAEGFGGSDADSTGGDRELGNRRDDGHLAADWVRKTPAKRHASVAKLALPKTLAASDLDLPVDARQGSAGPSSAPRIDHPEHGSLGRAQRTASGAPHQVTLAGEESSHSAWSFRVAKRTLDLVGASTGLILSSPFILAAVVAIKWVDRGPAFFCQTREGRHGQPFTIYKLRTMNVDAEKTQAALQQFSHRDGPAFKIRRDPRVTKVGQFLRATCLDELPQLINVLKGEMSFVGPRPLPWHESRACSRWHRRRLGVRPGLTCTWQVNKAKAETFDDWMRMDLQYVDRLGILKDLQLIARTVIVPVTGRGGE